MIWTGNPIFDAVINVFFISSAWIIGAIVLQKLGM
jgi:hypothetical protein